MGIQEALRRDAPRTRNGVPNILTHSSLPWGGQNSDSPAVTSIKTVCNQLYRSSTCCTSCNSQNAKRDFRVAGLVLEFQVQLLHTGDVLLEVVFDLLGGRVGDGGRDLDGRSHRHGHRDLMRQRRPPPSPDEQWQEADSPGHALNHGGWHDGRPGLDPRECLRLPKTEDGNYGSPCAPQHTLSVMASYKGFRV